MSATEREATPGGASRQQQPAESSSAAAPEFEFELGEDVSQQNREREQAWAAAKVEGREQLSARETMIK